MFWPSSITRELTLPEVELPKDTKNGTEAYAEMPHLDKIVDLASFGVAGAPYAAITHRGLYLFHSIHHAPLNCHLRSSESLAEFGQNVKVTLAPNARFLAVRTDRNYLLVYSLQPLGTDKEVLLVYAKNGQLVQNGYPSTNYNVKGGVGTNSEANSSLVSGLLQTFLGDGHGEKPCKDVNLRLKFILNCLIEVVDFAFVDNETIVTLQQDGDQTSAHLIKFKNKANYVARESGTDATPMYCSLALQSWFNDDSINGGSKIVNMEYLYELDVFVWTNERGDALLVKIDPASANLNFLAKRIYKCTDSVRAIAGKLNHHRSLIYVLLENGDFHIYKLKQDTDTTLLKIVKRTINSKNVRALVLDPLGSCAVMLFENGWNIYSLLGNLNFSSFDYDNINMVSFEGVAFVAQNQMVLSSGNKFLNVGLTRLNPGCGSRANALKRPVLCADDRITIFKMFEKKLFDHHHFNYNLNDVTDKDTNIWQSQMLPLEFRLGNSIVKDVAVSEDGNNVCIIGDYDVWYYNVGENLWKVLDVGGEIGGGSGESQFKRTPTPITSCGWWNNYLVMATRTQDKSEILMFSPKITERDSSFDFGAVLWIFNFEELGENFASFNVDHYNNELLVMTDNLSCYSWKLDIFEERLRVIKYVAYPLADCFPKGALQSMVHSLQAVYRMNEMDLLILSNTDLHVVQRVGQKSIAHLVSSSVEYVTKLNASSFAFFNGGQLMRYNLSNEKDVMKCVPIGLSIGNEVHQEGEAQLIKSTGTTSYPITTVAYKNIIIGLEVEFGKNGQLTFDTVRHNYLHDLVDHYIRMNIKVIREENTNGSHNALSIIGVYNEFHKAKNFKFVLERLLVDYIQQCDEDPKYDVEKEYFDKLNDLINMTASPYEIVLNCLKKSEVQYWSIFFAKRGLNPREIVNELFDVEGNYHLAAHFLIVMMNYEQRVGNTMLSNRDVKLTTKILTMLIVNEDFETCFALMRFIKVIDDKTCAKLYEKLVYKLSM